MTHGVFVRFNFVESDKRFPWRFDFFREKVLPCFQNQTDKDFDLWVLCNAAHRGGFESLGVKTLCPADGVNGYGGFRAGSLSYALPHYDIQTRHDCDDLVLPRYIERIKAECVGDGPLVISFVPWKYDLAMGKTFFSAERFGPKRPSMFLSLYRGRVSVYHEKHADMWKHGRVVTIPEGYCKLVVHGGNLQSRIFEADKKYTRRRK